MKKICCGAVLALALGAVAFGASIANAKDIKTLNASLDGETVAISGTADSKTLAVAIMVYNEAGSELLAMQTAAVADDGSYSSSIDLGSGTYLVKVANYEGGEYETVVVKPATSIPAAPNSGVAE